MNNILLEARGLELITTEFSADFSLASQDLKKYIDMLLTSGLYSQAKTLKYYETIQCITKKDGFSYGSLKNNFPVIGAFYLFDDGTQTVFINLNSIDQHYDGKDLHLSTPQPLLEALMYSTIVTKTLIELVKTKDIMMHMAYQNITDIYYSLIFRLLGKPYGLLEIDQVKLGTLRYCFCKYIAENWFSSDVDKAHMYAIQSTVAGKIIDFENRNKFIEFIKSSGLDKTSIPNIKTAIELVSKDIVVGLDLNKFIQMIYSKHGLFSIIAFEKPYYFIPTVVASKFSRKIPVSPFFSQVHKDASNKLIKYVDNVILKKTVMGC